MRKYLVALFIFIFAHNIMAKNPELAVESFSLLEMDPTARFKAPKIDQNGKKCAVIKVVTSETGFVFDFGMNGEGATEQHKGEIWVWVPIGTRKMTINHEYLGVLRNYEFEIDLEEATVYEMKLITAEVAKPQTQSGPVSQFLWIKAEPAKAMIYLDGQFVKTGEFSGRVKVGKHKYKVEMPLYHADSGEVKITSKEKSELFINLKPAFGYVKVTSSPELGASVLIDGKDQFQTTPCQSEPLASGEHTVMLVKEMYKPQTKTVKISDGEISLVDFVLQPNFADVSITAPAGAVIFVDNQQKGIGTWGGRLFSGVHSLEARLDKHRPARRDIDVIPGNSQSLELNPKPIFGSVDVMSTPAGATIEINGKQYGTTPNAINELLIGDYVVKLSKEGYTSASRKIMVPDGKTVEVVETLASIGQQVTINSVPFGADLFIDGKRVGNTPYSGNLPFGSHSLRITKNGVETKRNISLSPNSKELVEYELKLDMESYIKKSIENKVPQKPATPLHVMVGAGITYPLSTNAAGSITLNNVGCNFRIGILKTVGVYTKVTSNFSTTALDYTIDNLPSTYYCQSSTAVASSAYNRFGAVGGLLVNLDPIVLFAGAGWGNYKHYTTTNLYNYSDNSLVKSIHLGDKKSFTGIETNAGMMLNVNKFGITIEASSIQFKYMELSMGLAYTF